MRLGRSVRPALRRTAVALSALMFVTAAQALSPAAAGAATGPSVPLPDTPSTPVTRETQQSRPQDDATSNALRGDQPEEQGSVLPGAGTTQATSLSASASWSVSGYTGTFTWSYPFRVPPAPGGLEPKLALSYSSSAVDGRTSSTNNQASWVGDGWDLTPGFVERTYGSCADDTINAGRKTGDLCWRSDNATASYNGSAGPLIRDDASGTWRPEGDDGSRVEKLTGAGNGARDGEHWKITTVDGTQYFFGSQQDSRSTWTVPVLGDPASGGACRGEQADSSACTQAWRWNLDKVVDRHGNVVRYYYIPETDNYGFNLKDTAVPYVRGGTLDRIDYGLREGGGQAVGRVVFGVAERCVPDATCDRAHPQNWPDVPWESTCEASPCAKQHSPSFFSTKRLDTVTTKVWRGSDFGDVDSWQLDHQFPDPGDGGKASLWLKGIKHTGRVGGSISLPQVTFEGRAMANRVKGPTVDGYAPLLRYRVTGIVSETGGVVDVHYADPDCVWGRSMPDEAHPEHNTSRCFPVRWVPGAGFDPRVDYFQKYVVDTVTQLDRYGSSVGDVTGYEYPDGAAWHYDTSEFTPPDKKTWNEFRGFGRVLVRKGDGKDSPKTVSEQRFHRGMNGDTLPGGGSRSVSLTDSEGNTRADEDWLAGYPFEQTTFDGEGGPAITKTLSWPAWRGPTATRAGFEAYWTGTAATESYTALDGGRGWRVSRTDTEFDDDVGLPTKVNRVVDKANPADAKCTTTTYARNTEAWLLALPARVQTVAVACDQTPVFPDHAVSDVRTWYDGRDFGAVPTAGDITKTEQLDEHPASGPRYVTTSTATYDAYGRPLTVADPLNRTTRTAYTPITGGPVTKVTVTDPAGFATATEFEPAWGVPTKATDANLRVTESAYDALGRLTDSWLPNRPRSGNTANTSYAYLVRNDGPTAVTTKAIGPNGKYTSSVVLHDGLLRPRQAQSPAVGGGRLLTDTRYDSHGRAWTTTRPYSNSAAVDTDLWVAADSAVPGMTTTEYDGAGRTAASVFRVTGAEKWRATTRYGGDRVYTTPPDGGTATTVVRDAYGRTSELWQHEGPTPTGDHDTTKYTYTPGGQLATTVDPAGNTWSWTYDLRGRMVHAVDPDTGASDSSYDAAGQLLSTTDSSGNTLVHEYDVLGRRTTLHHGSLTGALLAKWDYDTAYKGKGMLAASTRYDDSGNAYATRIPNYNPLYQPGGVDVVVPASEGALADTYTTVFGYNPDGSLAALGLPKAGNLPAETVMHTYDDLGLPEQTSGADGNTTVFIASATEYTRYGEFSQVTLGSAGQRAWISNYYEDGSRRLKTSIVDAEVPTPMQAKVDYTYDAAGTITGISDAPTGAVPDHQCFRHDHLQRLVEAWTPGDGDCDADPAKDALGGAAPYWHTYGYDVTGNRASEVRHGVGTAADVTRTYHYPLPGQAQPHTLTSISVDGTTTDSYSYDASGNTTTRTVGGEPATHELDWDVEGRLASDKAGPAITSFVYDADGNRLLRKDPTSVTLYLGSQEVRLDKSTKARTTTRYYSHGGRVVAQRTASGVNGLAWLASDHQGTAQITVQPATMKVAKRRALPFGEPRGAAVTWANDRGFVGGTKDATGLTHLGAREYDPATGRFISADPLLVPGDPQQLNGYAYADNSPVTSSDPTGLLANCGPDNVGCGANNGDPEPTDAEKDAWNNRGGPGTGTSSGNTSSTLEVLDSECGPVRTVFVNPDNNADLSGYLLTLTTMQYTGILHTPPCVAVGANFCFDKGGDSLVGWEETVAVTATKYQCGEHDQTPGCGPFVSQGGPTTAEALAEIGKLIFDPTACVGSGASVGGCTIQIAGILPVGKILKGAGLAGKAIAEGADDFISAADHADDLGSAARTARNELGEARKGKHPAYSGAHDPETGRIYAGCSSNPTGCAEDDLARQIGKGPGAPVFTKAFGWRGKQWVEIPICVRCQSRYDQSQFPPDALFDPNGRWQK
ncbi:MAG: type IV secretion protein Rhs [Saccharothrix sp.]|nr:type IV secretion protein Rhs [Saccharothrix sp.]